MPRPAPSGGAHTRTQRRQRPAQKKAGWHVTESKPPRGSRSDRRLAGTSPHTHRQRAAARAHARARRGEGAPEGLPTRPIGGAPPRGAPRARGPSARGDARCGSHRAGGGGSGGRGGGGGGGGGATAGRRPQPPPPLSVWASRWYCRPSALRATPPNGRRPHDHSASARTTRPPRLATAAAPTAAADAAAAGVAGCATRRGGYDPLCQCAAGAFLAFLARRR